MLSEYLTFAAIVTAQCILHTSETIGNKSQFFFPGGQNFFFQIDLQLFKKPFQGFP